MKKQNKFLYLILSLGLLAIILGSLCFNIYQFVNTNGGALTKFLYILSALCHISALIYCLRGLKKNSAIYYKLFLMIYTITAALNLYVEVGNDKKNIIIIIFAILVLLFRGTLTFIEDLGKKVSYILAISLLVISIFLTLMFINLDKNMAIEMLGYISLDIILVLMVYAKYVDKGNRHTN